VRRSVQASRRVPQVGSEEEQVEVFVVRLWPGDPAMRGKLEHAASGTSHVFDSGQELLRLLADQLRTDQLRTDELPADVPGVAPATGAPLLRELEAPPA
jgi:hypothetical protein